MQIQEYTEWEWLLYSTAQNAGLKGSYEELMTWTEDNLSQLEDYEVAADNHPMFMKDVRAIRNVQRGNSINHIIGLDASWSGAQVMSLLQGCKKTMFQTNLIGDVIQDPYTNLIPQMNKYLSEEFKVVIGIEEGHMNRKDHIKPAAMTSAYGSTDEPKTILGDGTNQMKAFFQAMRDNVPAVLDIPSELKDMWNNQSGEYKWRKFFNPDDKNPYWARCVTKRDKFSDPVRIQNIYGLKGSFSYLLDDIGNPSDYTVPIIANVD